MNLNFNQENRILFASVGKEFENGDRVPLFNKIIRESNIHLALGVLIRNSYEDVSNLGTARRLGNMGERFKTVLAVANVKEHIPESNEIASYTILNANINSYGVQFKTFYDEDEALTWLDEIITESME